MLDTLLAGLEVFGIIFGVLAILAWAFDIVAWVELGNNEAINLELWKKYVRSDMNQDSHHFDAEGTRVEGPGAQTYKVPNRRGWFIWRILNVIIFVRPFVRIAPYLEHNDEDGFRGKGDAISLRPQQKELVNIRAESKSPGDSESMIPQDLRAYCRLEPVNLERFVYKSTNDVVVKAIKSISARARRAIRSLTPTELQDSVDLVASTTGAVRADFEAEIARLEREDGIRVIPGSINVESIEYSEKVREAQQRRTIEILEAQAVAAGISAFKLGLIAGELGITVEALKEKLATDPNFIVSDAYKAAYKQAEPTDMAKRKHAADKGELMDQRFGSTDGSKFDGTIIAMPGGVGKRGH